VITWIVAGELLVTVAGTAAFLVFYGAPWRHSERAVAWHIAGFSAAAGIEALSLLLLALGLAPPAWVYVLVFGLMDAAVLQRMWLLLRDRRR
jgi:hypothetical protein